MVVHFLLMRLQLLHSYFTSMKDKKLVSIVIDRDEAMWFLIDEVFPKAHHCLCSRHIMRNVNSNVDNPEIVREFNYYVDGG